MACWVSRIAIALMEALDGQRFPYEIEVVGFSEESGQRFGTAFLGSRALVGRIDEQLLESKDSSDMTLREAILRYGLDPAEVAGRGDLNGCFCVSRISHRTRSCAREPS